jgi:hypothetical protein
MHLGKSTIANKINRMNIFFAAFLSIVSLSCSNGPSNEKVNYMDTSKFYDDVNLFALAGVNELRQSELNYPYIEINKSKNNTVLLKYHATKKVVYTENYVSQGDTWASFHFVNEGVDTTYFYKFVFKDKIVRLRYKGNPEGSSYELMTLSIMDSSYKEISYSFAEGLKVKPTNDVNKLLTHKVVRHGYTNYSIADGKLTVSNKIFDDISKKTILEEMTCYKIGKHSFFWWDYFGPLTTKIVCN